MNKLYRFIVVVPLLLLSHQALANDNKGKVVVSQFSEFTEITEHVKAFDTWPELAEYLALNVNTKPKEAISALTAFQKKLPNLTPEQLSQMNLMWAKAALAQGSVETASHKLALVTEAMLTPNETLEYVLLKGSVLTLQHALFEAGNAYQTAYQLAIEQNQVKVANSVSLTLANLYYDLNAQTTAQDWLAKVEFAIGDDTDLATLIETATKLAELQQKMALYEQAESVLKRTIEYLGTKKLVSVQLSLSFQLAQVYLAWPNYELAQQTLEQNFVQAQKLRSTNQQMQALVGLMELALIQEKPWQASKLLVQANKLETYVYDVKAKQSFWQTKAKVLAAKGQFRQALQVLAQYENSVNTSKAEQTWLGLLDEKVLWQLKSGNTTQAQETFKAYQALSQRVANLHSSRQIDFLQQSRRADQQNASLAQQQIQAKYSQAQAESDNRQSRIYALYVVIVLIIGAAAVGMYWLYRKFSYERDLDTLADPVSGAYNHKFLSRQFEYLKYKKHKIALVMFDVDNMQAINAQLGHEMADHLLHLMVQRLKKRLVRNTWLIRTSGDRFVVLANNFDQKQAFILAEILRKELNSSDFKVSKHKVKLRASFAALECLPKQDLEAIKSKLEQVVAKVKQLGGDLVKAES